MASEYPFKFLDAYEKKDKKKFFGREEEIEMLYQTTFQTNLTLVYGRSGVGKTSLIQCGLANRFDSADWFHIYLRRRNNINDALIDILKGYKIEEQETSSFLQQRLSKIREKQNLASDGGTDGKDAGVQVINLLKSIYSFYLRPIYLLFDQFEELFILGSEEEQAQFYQTVALILEKLPYCKVIFVMREEYIAELYDFEKVVPSLFDKRMRVEPMTQVKAQQVISSIARDFDIELESDQVPETIVDNVTERKGRVQLTYLQVFLDKLYRLAEEKNADDIQFTMELIHEIGNIDDVLNDFLEEQLGVFDQEVDSQNNALTFLKAFVSNKGTKVPVARFELFEQLPELEDKLILQCIDFFVSRRILRPLENDQYELSHDSLAAKIAKTKWQLLEMPKISTKELSFKENPFPGYKAYSRDYAATFFGRDAETQILFDKIINEPRVRSTLLYGQLGVGKTSLLQAGLLPRLEQVAKVAYIKCTKTSVEEGAMEKMLQNVRVLGKQLHVFIFDQFEEFIQWAFIEQQMDFYKLVTQKLKENKRARFLFSIQEQYFSELYEFEKILPELFENRLRIEPVSFAHAFLIIQKNLEYSSVEVENPNLIEKILDNISGENQKIDLTQLQLYMKRLMNRI